MEGPTGNERNQKIAAGIALGEIILDDADDRSTLRDGIELLPVGVASTHFLRPTHSDNVDIRRNINEIDTDTDPLSASVSSNGNVGAFPIYPSGQNNDDENTVITDSSNNASETVTNTPVLEANLVQSIPTYPATELLIVKAAPNRLLHVIIGIVVLITFIVVRVVIEVVGNTRSNITSVPPSTCFKDGTELRLAVAMYVDGDVNGYIKRTYGYPIGSWCVDKVEYFISTFAADPHVFSNHAGNKFFNEDISKWNTSSAISMKNMFSSASAFNQDLNSWDVSKVTDMTMMFAGASAFNKDIGSWNVSKVTDMSYMFSRAQAFNQDLGSWDVSEVTDMSSMFRGASAFNQDLGSWNVSKVRDMSFMFAGTSYWEVAIKDRSDMFAGTLLWHKANFTVVSAMFADAFQDPDRSGMLAGASSFNQDLGSWDVSNVISMESMFFCSLAFNQDIRLWDVSKVTDMNNMFAGSLAFNQDLGSWNVSKVSTMKGMFAAALAFNQDLNLWDVSNVTAMSFMFAFALAFNKDLGSWDVSKVTNMNGMFGGAHVFNQNLCPWKGRASVGTVVSDLFSETSCPEESDPVIPVGPFCYACSYQMFNQIQLTKKMKNQDR